MQYIFANHVIFYWIYIAKNKTKHDNVRLELRIYMYTYMYRMFWIYVHEFSNVGIAKTVKLWLD